MSSTTSFRAQICPDSSDSESDDSGTYWSMDFQGTPWSMGSTDSPRVLKDEGKDDQNMTKLDMNCDLADHVSPNSTYKSNDNGSEKSHKLQQDLSKTIKT